MKTRTRVAASRAAIVPCRGSFLARLRLVLAITILAVTSAGCQSENESENHTVREPDPVTPTVSQEETPPAAGASGPAIDLSEYGHPILELPGRRPRDVSYDWQPIYERALRRRVGRLGDDHSIEDLEELIDLTASYRLDYEKRTGHRPRSAQDRGLFVELAEVIRDWVDGRPALERLVLSTLAERAVEAGPSNRIVIPDVLPPARLAHFLSDSDSGVRSMAASLLAVSESWPNDPYQPANWKSFGLSEHELLSQLREALPTFDNAGRADAELLLARRNPELVLMLGSLDRALSTGIEPILAGDVLCGEFERALELRRNFDTNNSSAVDEAAVALLPLVEQLVAPDRLVGWRKRMAEDCLPTLIRLVPIAEQVWVDAVLAHPEDLRRVQWSGDAHAELSRAAVRRLNGEVERALTRIQSADGSWASSDEIPRAVDENLARDIALVELFQGRGSGAPKVIDEIIDDLSHEEEARRDFAARQLSRLQAEGVCLETPLREALTRERSGDVLFHLVSGLSQISLPSRRTLDSLTSFYENGLVRTRPDRTGLENEGDATEQILSAALDRWQTELSDTSSTPPGLGRPTEPISLSAAPLPRLGTIPPSEERPALFTSRDLVVMPNAQWNDTLILNGEQLARVDSDQLELPIEPLSSQQAAAVVSRHFGAQTSDGFAAVGIVSGCSAEVVAVIAPDGRLLEPGGLNGLLSHLECPRDSVELYRDGTHLGRALISGSPLGTSQPACLAGQAFNIEVPTQIDQARGLVFTLGLDVRSSPAPDLSSFWRATGAIFDRSETVLDFRGAADIDHDGSVEIVISSSPRDGIGQSSWAIYDLVDGRWQVVFEWWFGMGC